MHCKSSTAVLIGLFAFSPSIAWAQTPTGEGDPATISCKPPQKLPSSNFSGPKVCKTNAEWAQYYKDGMDVTPDGKHDVRVRPPRP